MTWKLFAPNKSHVSLIFSQQVEWRGLANTDVGTWVSSIFEARDHVIRRETQADLVRLPRPRARTQARPHQRLRGSLSRQGHLASVGVEGGRKEIKVMACKYKRKAASTGSASSASTSNSRPDGHRPSDVQRLPWQESYVSMP